MLRLFQAAPQVQAAISSTPLAEWQIVYQSYFLKAMQQMPHTAPHLQEYTHVFEEITKQCLMYYGVLDK